MLHRYFTTRMVALAGVLLFAAVVVFAAIQNR
jgi:hypothetical protein